MSHLTTLAGLQTGDQFTIIDGTSRQHWTVTGVNSATPTGMDGMDYEIPEMEFFLEALLREGRVFRRDSQPPEYGEWWTWGSYRCLVLAYQAPVARVACFTHGGGYSQIRDVPNLDEAGYRSEPIAVSGDCLVALMQSFDQVLTQVRDAREAQRKVGRYEYAMRQIRQCAEEARF